MAFDLDGLVLLRIVVFRLGVRAQKSEHSRVLAVLRQRYGLLQGPLLIMSRVDYSQDIVSSGRHFRSFALVASISSGRHVGGQRVFKSVVSPRSSRITGRRLDDADVCPGQAGYALRLPVNRNTNDRDPSSNRNLRCKNDGNSGAAGTPVSAFSGDYPHPISSR